MKIEKQELIITTEKEDLKDFRANKNKQTKNSTEPISTKIDSYRASAFHLGVQDLSVAYREASCIATFKASECT